MDKNELNYLLRNLESGIELLREEICKKNNGANIIARIGTVYYRAILLNRWKKTNKPPVGGSSGE